MNDKLYLEKTTPDFLKSIKTKAVSFEHIDILLISAKEEFNTFKKSFDYFLPYLNYDYNKEFEKYSFDVFEILLQHVDKRGFFYLYKHLFKLDYLEDELIISNTNTNDLIRVIDFNDIYINIFHKYSQKDTDQLINIFRLINQNLNIPFNYSYYRIKDEHVNFLTICLNKIKNGRLNLIPLLSYYDQGSEPTFFKFYYNDKRNDKYTLKDTIHKFSTLFLNFSHIIMKDKSQGLRALSAYKEWDQLTNKFFKNIPKGLLLSDIDNIIFTLNDFFSKKYNSMIFNGHDFKTIAQKLIMHFTTKPDNNNHITDIFERLFKIFNVEQCLILDTIEQTYNSISFQSYIEQNKINEYNKHLIDLLFIKYQKLMLNQIKDSQQTDSTEKRKRL